MNKQRSAHLDYEQLLNVLVDKSDLEDQALAHLEACAVCQNKVERMAKRYDNLGKMVKKMAPEPSQAFRIPEQPTVKSRWRFNPALALGAVGAMIFIFTVLGPKQKESPDATAPMVAQNSANIDLVDDPLMDEIDDLVADALPVAYRELASVSDSQSIEELIELIVPTIEEDEGVEPRA